VARWFHHCFTAPVSVFGDSPEFTAGTASSGGTPAITASVTLAYESGTSFSGLPDGTLRIALAHRGNEYRISSVDGPTASVQRFVNGAVDNTWPGFATRTVVDFRHRVLTTTIRGWGHFWPALKTK
jgi:hypothetical protein